MKALSAAVVAGLTMYFVDMEFNRGKLYVGAERMTMGIMRGFGAR